MPSIVPHTNTNPMNCEKLQFVDFFNEIRRREIFGNHVCLMAETKMTV